MNEKRNPGPHDSGTLIPALKIGALSGASGLVYGATSGVLRSHRHPIIHSISTGIYSTAFGTSFWWLRSNILKIQFEGNPTDRERTYASIIAGGLSGGAVAWTIHRRFLPGLVIFSLCGGLGQAAFYAVDKWQAKLANGPRKPLAERISESKWVPIKALSDEKYKEMLHEKLLNVEVEIALIDERLKELAESQPFENSNGRD